MSLGDLNPKAAICLQKHHDLSKGEKHMSKRQNAPTDAKNVPLHCKQAVPSWLNIYRNHILLYNYCIPVAVLIAL